jgi:cation transport ATPase
MTDAPQEERALISRRAVGLAVAAVLFVAGVVLAVDNWRLGIGWTKDGPEAGYFPFALSVLMCIFSLVALVDAWRSRADASNDSFVTREQAYRVLTVLAPMVAFAAVTQMLGIYVASAALIAGFMRFVGGARTPVSVGIALAVTVGFFWLFEIQFQVPLPKGPVEDWLGY